MAQLALLSALRVSVSLAATASSFGPEPHCDLWVSTEGSDSAAGTSAATALRTVRHAIGMRNAKVPGSRTICLRSGLYELPSTLQVTAAVADSGRGLTITTSPQDLAAGLGRAVLSGGIDVGPFKQQAAPSKWLAATPPPTHHRPSLLFKATSKDSSSGAGRSWLQRARLPRRSPLDEATRWTGDASTFRYAGPLQQPNASKVWPAIDRTGFMYNTSDSFVQHLPLYRQDDVEILHFHAWVAFWSNISSISDGKLLFDTPTLTDVGQWATQGGQRFYFESVREGLADPGDWYWDETAGEVLLVPDERDGDTTTTGGDSVYAIAPQLEVLIEIAGATHVTLSDLEFAYADLPATGRANV